MKAKYLIHPVTKTSEYLKGYRNGLKIAFAFLQTAYSHLIWAITELQIEGEKNKLPDSLLPCATTNVHDALGIPWCGLPSSAL